MHAKLHHGSDHGKLEHPVIHQFLTTYTANVI
jgi:hypothetical protein